MPCQATAPVSTLHRPPFSVWTCPGTTCSFTQGLLAFLSNLLSTGIQYSGAWRTRSLNINQLSWALLSSRASSIEADFYQADPWRRQSLPSWSKLALHPPPCPKELELHHLMILAAQAALELHILPPYWWAQGPPQHTSCLAPLWNWVIFWNSFVQSAIPATNVTAQAFLCNSWQQSILWIYQAEYLLTEEVPGDASMSYYCIPETPTKAFLIHQQDVYRGHLSPHPSSDNNLTQNLYQFFLKSMLKRIPAASPLLPRMVT